MRAKSISALKINSIPDLVPTLFQESIFTSITRPKISPLSSFKTIKTYFRIDILCVKRSTYFKSLSTII
jgi:hypothetical protein